MSKSSTIHCSKSFGDHKARGETTTMEEESAPGPSSSKRSRVRDISPTEQEFRDIGIVIMKREKYRNLSEFSFLRRWNSYFGVSPKLCAHIWDNLFQPSLLLKLVA